MNYTFLRFILGCILVFESAFLAPSFLVGLLYQEAESISILITMGLCLAIGLPLMWKKKGQKMIFYAREGFVAVSLSWIVMSVMGALPFLFSGAIKSPINALFETVSGFTTTGASILSDVESLPKCILFWRSFTHWVGGMGVLVFMLTILPMTGGSHMNLMKAESPGPSVERIVPKVRSTSRILYTIYIVLTLIQIVLLLLGNMPLFDAVTTAFGTAGTGGFGIKNTSIADYSPYIQNVVTVFMILFGINFNIYFLFLCGKFKQALLSEELRCYLGVIAVSIIVIAFNIQGSFSSLSDAFHHSAFQVGSIITTTGFATHDFNTWPVLSKTILVCLMFIGACAGSTGGGMKVSRWVLLSKSIFKELHQFLHPHSVRKTKIDGKTVEHEVIRSTNVFMVVYVFIFAFSLLLVSIDNYDLTTNFTAVAATMNNIGPGLELVGPTANFAHFSNGVKLVLIFDMLVGRLEIFPMMLLFMKNTWKKF